MIRLRAPALCVCLAAAMLALAACTPAPGAPDVANSQSTQVVTVSLTDFGFKFTPDTIKPGDVKIVVRNDARYMMHEMWLVKTNLALDQLPLSSDGTKIDETSTTFTKLASVDDLDPGKTGLMTVTLPAGRYVYFCNQPGHYRLGMRGELTVTP